MVQTCTIPEKWRYTLTLALRALIERHHILENENGCNTALQCAKELGLDPDLVVKYTHLQDSAEVQRG